MSAEKIRLEYDDTTVRRFMLASIIWGIVGMTVGLLIALQLNFHVLNLNMEWLTFGRLRPLHTNAVIFAFVGNMMFAGVYYSLQRLTKARLASGFLSNLHFWGWQAIIVSAAVTLPLGLTRGKEYAELIWPINVAVALIWVVFAVNFFWTLARRNEPSIYVAIWFYIATIITVAILYIVNHLSLPTSLLHSYPVFGGVQDALVQWWYGHNAVAFFLTTPILGIMYYFMPKAAGRPVYSYRLSIVHFWSLIFIYIWAGPHHLLNTALPGWLQSLGMIFSLMLWAPSWGGMLNGLLTLRGAWDKLRTDPVIKFFVAAITFYGMATFEGPLLSIRSVSALGHYTDWIIGHVHGGALGWNGFMAAGMFYWLAPRLWNTKLHSISLANIHFWLGLVGILLYVASMWVSGITQQLMLNATVENGTVLKYASFVETLEAIRPEMLLRAAGGGLYLVGFIIGAYNIFRTVASGSAFNGSVEVVVEKASPERDLGLVGGILSAPVIYGILGTGACVLWIYGSTYGQQLLGMVGMVGTFAIVIAAVVHFKSGWQGWNSWHDKLLENVLPFSVLVFVAVALGGLIQIIPTVLVNKAENVEDRRQVLYTPLELAGRDLYVSEGCYNCHSQMIRTLEPDVMRYGDYSRLGESIYDHPYQWGSKRTGPDLARESGKRGNDWHYMHLFNPRSLEGKSNMPNYPWLFVQKADLDSLPRRIEIQRMLGVPWPEASAEKVIASAKEQAASIAADLKSKQFAGEFPSTADIADKKIVALIAYLQKVGTYEKVGPAKVAEAK